MWKKNHIKYSQISRIKIKGWKDKVVNLAKSQDTEYILAVPGGLWFYVSQHFCIFYLSHFSG